MAVKLAVIVRGAELRNGDPPNPDPLGLCRQDRPQVHVALCSRVSPRDATGVHYLTPDFITGTANTYSTMHYHIANRGTLPLQKGQSFGQNPGGGAPPPRVQQGNPLPHGVGQIDRNTVGGSDPEQDTWGRGAVTVESLNEPDSVPSKMPADLDPVHLAGGDDAGEPGIHGEKIAPAIKHFASRPSHGQAEVRTGRITREGDPRDDAVLVTPTGEFQQRKRSGFAERFPLRLSHPRE